MKDTRQSDASFQQSLAAELRRLRSDRSRLDQKIKAAELLLEGYNETPVNQGGFEGQSQSLASILKSILAKHSRSVSPIDLCNQIQAEGIQTGRSGDLRTAVSTELYRLAHSKNSGVERAGRGKYRMRKVNTGGDGDN